MDNRLIVRYHLITLNGMGRWNAGTRGVGAAAWKPSGPLRGIGGDPELAGQPKGKALGEPDEKSIPGVVWCPYRKPTQVGRGHSPQADERTLVKELGKLTP